MKLSELLEAKKSPEQKKVDRKALQLEKALKKMKIDVSKKSKSYDGDITAHTLSFAVGDKKVSVEVNWSWDGGMVQAYYSADGPGFHDDGVLRLTPKQFVSMLKKA